MANAFCPPFEVTAEDPGRLAIGLRAGDSGDELRLRYRSERGLFLRTYFLVVESDLPGEGPPEAGKLILSHGRLRWKRPKPPGGKEWSNGFASPDVRAALKRLQIERFTLGWEPSRAIWRLTLETLLGSVTVTFFPAIMTPNPLKREEAEAIEALLRALKHAHGRRPG